MSLKGPPGKRELEDRTDEALSSDDRTYAASRSQRRHTSPVPTLELRRSRSGSLSETPLSARTSFSTDLRRTTVVNSARKANSARASRGYSSIDLTLVSPVSSPRDRQSVEEFVNEQTAFVAEHIPQMEHKDFFDKEHLGSKRVIDKAMEALSNLIIEDIVQQKNPALRKQNFDFYCKCFYHAFHSNDFNTAFFILTALRNYQVDRFRKKVYSVKTKSNGTSYEVVSEETERYKQAKKVDQKNFLEVPSKVKSLFKKAHLFFDEAKGSYERHLQKHFKSKTDVFYIPWLIPLMKKADKISQIDENKDMAEFNFLREFDHCKLAASRFKPSLSRARSSSISLTTTPRDNGLGAGAGATPHHSPRTSTLSLLDDDSSVAIEVDDTEDADTTTTVRDGYRLDAGELSARLMQLSLEQTTTDGLEWDSADDSSTAVVVDEETWKAARTPPVIFRDCKTPPPLPEEDALSRRVSQEFRQKEETTKPNGTNKL